MRASALTLAAAALAAGTFLLTGCEPANSAGRSGTSDGAGIGCDPNGFGPFSGCDGTNDPVPREDSPETAADSPPPDEDEDEEAGKPDEDEAAGKPTGYQIREHTITEEHYDITVTWIVVSIRFTGFRECVIGLREAAADPGDHFSRRITTPEDCEAQQVHTVYRPVVKVGR